MTTGGLERLDVWRKAKDLAVRVYREVIPILPLEEKWALAQQLRRSVQSIPANLAEGYGRFYFQENIHFARVARGSLEETLSHLTLAYEIGYIPESLYKAITAEGNTLDKLICGYVAYLKRSRQGEHEPGGSVQINESLDVYIGNQQQLDEETDLGSPFSDLATSGQERIE